MDTPSAATSTTAIAPARSHYTILDGLRGVASLTVVLFHLCEPWSDGHHDRQIINHGYLAVDFFFLLSGFVIAYAYDDRWPRMSQWQFYNRRLIRLQPMVIVGSIIGALLFYPGASATFPLIAHTPVWKMLLVMLLGFTLLPLPYQFDIRGWQEMHPLDGPAWSLFFEYIGNILYATVVRRLSNLILGLVTFLAGLFLLHMCIADGDAIGGWATDARQLHIGFARLLFPFFAGILLMRSGRRLHTPAPFALASLLLLAALAVPRIGQTFLSNGLYDAFAILLIFPLIVAIGAGEKRADGPSLRIARFFGDLSYPLYITHYPLIYLYTAWHDTQHPTPLHGLLVGALTFLLAITIAFTTLKLLDEPARRWLSRRFLRTT